MDFYGAGRFAGKASLLKARSMVFRKALKITQVSAALLLAFFLTAFLARRMTGQSYFYFQKGQPPAAAGEPRGASIPTGLQGLSAVFSFPHQNRPQESFWLHLTLTGGSDWPAERQTQFRLLSLSLKDNRGVPALLEGRRSANPDFARSVHFEDGALVGLRTMPFRNFFTAGIPFDLPRPPRELRLDYAFTIDSEDGLEKKLQGTFVLERGTKQKQFFKR